MEKGNLFLALNFMVFPLYGRMNSLMCNFEPSLAVGP
jgi:hypothetical protein